MSPVMVGPIAGKTLVVGGRLGLLRELLSLYNGKQIGDQAVGLVTVSGEVEGYPDSGSIGDILVNLPHVFIGNRPPAVPPQYLAF